MLKIGIRNIKRWMELGAERKKGGGRKVLDDKMENELYQLIYENKDELKAQT